MIFQYFIVITVASLIAPIYTWPLYRIVNGEAVDISRWSFMVSIQIRTAHGKFKHYCGGIIWNSNHIITAAHCLAINSTLGMVPSDLLQIWTGHKNLKHISEGFTFEVEKIEIHEKFEKLHMINDIAIIKLKQSIDFHGKHHRLSCACRLKPKRDIDPRECRTIGWGRLSYEGPMSETLSEISLPILNNSACKLQKSVDVETKLCAGFMKGGKDSCQGDSGGPLLCSVKESSKKKFVFIGIVSYGNECGKSPGYYTRVSGYLPWLREHTGCG